MLKVPPVVEEMKDVILLPVHLMERASGTGSSYFKAKKGIEFF